MHALDTNEIFGTTFYTYDRIMEVGGKNGPDAFALYVKYLKQSRIQETNQTKTLNAFLREGLGRGDKRVKNARAILKELGLIDDVIIRDELGKMRGHYVRVNYLINENKVRNACSTYNLSTTAPDHDVESARCGGMDTNALSTKYINAGSTKEKICLPESETPDNIKEKKEKVAAKERKESGGGEYSEEFEKFWKLYPAPSGRGSKKDSRKKWNSWSDEDVEKIKMKILEEYIYVESGKKEKKRVCAFEKFLENNRGIDFDLESFVIELMENKKDKDNIGIKLAKEYLGEENVRRFIKKYIMTHDSMVLDLH